MVEKETIHIEFIEHDVIEQLKLTTLVEDNELLHVRVTKDTKFIDNIWDFSNYNIKNQSDSSYVFKFDDVEYNYRNYLKSFVLRKIYEKKLTIPTINSKANKIKIFLAYLKQQSVFTIELMNVYEIDEYLNTKSDLKESSLIAIKVALKEFMMEIEAKNVDIDFEEIYEMLGKVNSKKYKYEREMGKHPLIPKEIHKKIIQCALDDLETKQLDLIDKMSACIIIILAETGMRVMEFQNLKGNSLKDLSMNDSNSRIFYYLEFTTYKTVKPINGEKTQSFVTEKAKLAYQTLDEVLQERRGLGDNYLYCNNKGEAYDTRTLRHHIKRFFIRHKFELNISNLTRSERECFSILEIDEEVAKSISWLNNDNIGEEVYYVTPHQFRVYLATDLYNKGVNIDWIRRHMNHMSPVMTEHYIRLQQEEKRSRNQIETLLLRTSKTGILETNKEAIIEKDVKKELDNEIYCKAYSDINKFLKKYKLNIYENLDEIIALLGKTQTPIIETELGYCAHKGFLRLCKHQEYISSLNDGYHIGVILPTIEEFSFTYQRFKEKAQIVDYNEGLKKKDSRYEREYLKEVNALNYFISTKVEIELSELKKELKDKGEPYVKAAYPKMLDIIKNLGKVEEEVVLWKKKLEHKLKNL